jgi:hypothetical protein
MKKSDEDDLDETAHIVLRIQSHMRSRGYSVIKQNVTGLILLS